GPAGGRGAHHGVLRVSPPAGRDPRGDGGGIRCRPSGGGVPRTDQDPRGGAARLAGRAGGVGGRRRGSRRDNRGRPGCTTGRNGHDAGAGGPAGGRAGGGGRPPQRGDHRGRPRARSSEARGVRGCRRRRSARDRLSGTLAAVTTPTPFYVTTPIYYVNDA